MFLRKLGAVLATALAVSAVTAGTSQAMVAVTTETKPPGYSGPLQVMPTSSPRIEGSSGGTKIVIQPGGLESSPAFALEQNGTLAQLVGAIKFTSVSVTAPTKCKTAVSFETSQLAGTIQMGNTEATKAGLYTKFVPTSGEVIATIKLEGEGCTVAGSYQLKGTLYGKNTNGTGVYALAQETSFSGAINSSQGGALTLGKEAATMEGGIKASLKGGEEWEDNE